MSDIIDFETKNKQKRDKESEPSQSCKYRDGDGIDWFKFSVTYVHENRNYSFYLWAKSKEDAESRIFSIKRFPCEIIQILDEVYL